MNEQRLKGRKEKESRGRVGRKEQLGKIKEGKWQRTKVQ